MRYETIIPIEEDTRYSLKITSETYIPLQKWSENIHLFDISWLFSTMIESPRNSREYWFDLPSVNRDGSYTFKMTYKALIETVRIILNKENYAFACSRDS